ncbi:MAG: endolytic transglycosylase MltG [Mariprofundaceae bacterium]
MHRNILLAVLFLVGIGFVWQQTVTDMVPDQAMEVVIPKGASSKRIAQELKDAGVIRSAAVFRMLARLTGKASALQSGYYYFEQPADMWQVLDRIHRGDVRQFHITVPEGLRTDEVLVLLAQQTGIAQSNWQEQMTALVGSEKREGYLLPETYTYEKPLRPRRLLAQMIESQQTLLAELTAGNAEDRVDISRLRIIASIVEKETSVDAERPLIAAVIYNRLKRRMALQMDPTVIYGLWRTDGSFSGNIRKADLKRDTPWNTYTRKGLPPTPICNPGAASLRAAMNPADVDYLYFVADGSGGHAFAGTHAEHEANVRRWIRIERQIGRQIGGQQGAKENAAAQ